MKEDILRDFYLTKKLSVSAIAKKFCVSESKINYWLFKYGIGKRSISEAIYIKKNPQGDPFRFKIPKTRADLILYGLGIGLYWGEGNKRNKNSLRLGNVDPNLIKAHISFLERIYSIDKSKLKFGLQIFSDVSPNIAQKFWIDKLNINLSQFHKVIVTPARGIGNYKNKSKYGVLTVYFNNSKLKKRIDNLIESFPLV
ncbi:MAG: hypothetical protein NUV98_03380 [Candidatus Roizmanbacteria bacterium]|nr:hypothetical protein [Candidatus Roizmanbacteria bacterium]